MFIIIINCESCKRRNTIF